MKIFLVVLMTAVGILIDGCGKSTSTHADHGDSTGVTASEDYYTCSMHPQVHSPTPGQCPICSMDLVKASNSKRSMETGTEAMVPLNERGQLLANVATVTVGYDDVQHSVRAFGTLEIAEPNKSVISARFNGRIEQLHVNAVGTTVNVGDPLFTLYSPDLIQAETEFLQALRDQSPSASNNRSTGRAKLLLLGLTDDQIRDLESKETAPLLVTYRSPARGVVVEKNIAVGAYVSEGATLYEIADLSMLWNVAEIYESDARHIKVGDRAKVAISTYPGESFSATVSLIYPVVNPQTRTVKVRLRIDNSSGKLRPNMFTETIFTRKMARSLAIPVNTVLVTGKRNLVYVKADHENHFEAREVGLGTRFDGKYEILWGLQEGEIVVSQGGYLIDSESQLRSGSGASHQHGVSAPTDTPKEEPDQHIH